MKSLQLFLALVLLSLTSFSIQGCWWDPVVIKEPIILKCQPKSYPVEYSETLEQLILLPAQIKDSNGKYIPNPAIIGGFTEDGVEAIQRNMGKLYKWGATNQKYLEEINASTEEFEVEQE